MWVLTFTEFKDGKMKHVPGGRRMKENLASCSPSSLHQQSQTLLWRCRSPNETEHPTFTHASTLDSVGYNRQTMKHTQVTQRKNPYILGKSAFQIRGTRYTNLIFIQKVHSRAGHVGKSQHSGGGDRGIASSTRHPESSQTSRGTRQHCLKNNQNKAGITPQTG